MPEEAGKSYRCDDWRTQTAEDRMLGDADIAFSDDVGTTYQVMPSGWSGSGRQSSGETLIVPKPPQDAQILTIEVRSFGRMDWMPLPALDVASSRRGRRPLAF